MGDYEVSIIIPAYNEGNRIGNTLKDYVGFFSRISKDKFEILVILNGCTDNTLEIVKKFRKDGVRYKNFTGKIGKGGAIIEGFKMANGEVIGFVDADLSTRPEAFYDLIMRIGDYDGIIASRWIKGAKIEVKQHLARRISSRGFNILVRLLFGIRIRDTQCGAKLFKKHAIKKIVNNLGISNWAFDIDLLYSMKKNNFEVIEVPTEWSEPGDSHLNLKKTIPEMFLAIIRLRLIYSPFRFIVKLYDKIM